MANVHLAGRRSFAFLLSISMLAALTACKRSTKENEEMYSSGRIIQATDPYFLADVNRVKIPEQYGMILESQSVNECVYTGQYAIVTYYQEYKIPEDIQAKVDSGSDLLGIDLSPYYIDRTSIFDKEGNFIKDIGGEKDGILGVTVDKDNNIHLLSNHYTPLSFDAEMSRAEIDKAISEHKSNTICMDVYDHEGNALKSVPIPDITNATYSYGATLEILNNGNYAYSSSGHISVFDADGKMICEISDKDRLLKGGIIQENNKNYVVSSNGNYSDNASTLLKEVDISNGKLSGGTDVSVLSSYGTIVATQNGLFANSYSGCFKYDIQRASVEQIFSWNDTDVDRALMKDISVTPKSENEILAIGHKSYESNMPFLIHLTRAETNPHAGKRLIVIGGENLSQCTDLLSFASSYSYNEKNSARIVLVDYTEGLNEDEGYSDIERSIYLDTLSGSGPDILVNMFDSVAFRTDAIMEDMNQYIDGRDGIKRKKYFDNIFRACETNGCLYHIPVRFGLEGLTVNTDIVPGSVGWTYSEFFEASGKVPEEVSFVQGVLYNELLELMLGTSLPQFVDYKNGTVDFLNEDMKHILETVKKYGVTKIPDDEAEVHMKKVVPDEGSLEGEFDLCQEKFKEGMLAIKVSWLNNVYDVAASRDYCAGTAAFVGFPAREKTAMAVSPSLTLGIVSSSKCKGLAWDFIRAFMEGEGQEYSLQFSSSVRKEAFEKEAKIMMDNRNEFYESVAKDGPQIARMMVTPVIDEDFSTFKELAENVTISTGGDPAIFNIICEEAAGYFSGDRSVEEVMKNIQNRASIVVKEL